MDKNTAKTTDWPEPHDLWAAFSLLTRLPVPVDHARAGERTAHAVWAYPIVGAVISALGALVAWGLTSLGAPSLVAALVAVMTMILATGALHEDGLADCADGLMGGATPERRLEIMRDSQVGSYGALALVSSVGLRAACLAALIPQGLLAFVAVGALSRAAMVLVATTVPDARRTGLGQGFGQAPKAALWLCLALSIGAALLIGPLSGALVIIVAGAWVALFAFTAKRLIGGRTGDVLGASQQVFEMAGLVVLTLTLA